MKRTRRTGFTVIECCAAAAMLVATLTVVMTLSAAVARKRQTATWQALAIVEADNLLERLTVEPYADLTSERVVAMDLGSRLAERLPQGTVAVRVDEQAGPPERKRIQVELAWQPPRTDQPRRHRVVTWVYAQQGRP